VIGTVVLNTVAVENKFGTESELNVRQLEIGIYGLEYIYVGKILKLIKQDVKFFHKSKF
jgi:hypothetical protein